MHQKVEAYLSARQKELDDAEQKKKNETLIRLGLYEKVYQDVENGPQKEYDQSEWNTEKHEYRYFRTEPIEVTDEEYAQILKYEKTAAEKNRSSGISNAMKVIGILTYIGALILGIFMGKDNGGNEEFAILQAVDWWAEGFISGTLFLWLSKIISLLEEIRDK